MGCDIHMFTEKKIGDRWETADFFHYAPGIFNEIELTRLEFMGDRNYRLFARLADIRNGYGVEPIDTPRGVPKDLSEYVQNWYDTEHGWTFGHSYLTLRDILEFKPTEDVYIGGYTTQQNANMIEAGLDPSNFSIYEEPEGEHKVYVEFQEKDETFEWFIEKLKERVEDIWWTFAYKPEEYLDNFRLVFWFDN